MIKILPSVSPLHFCYVNTKAIMKSSFSIPQDINELHHGNHRTHYMILA